MEGNCRTKRSFFCVENIETTTHEQTTISGKNDRYSAVVQNSPAIAVAIFLVILLIAGACFMKSGKAKAPLKKTKKIEKRQISKTLSGYFLYTLYYFNLKYYL